MKKCVFIAMILVLCLGMSITAAAGEFVPSIEYKETPDVVMAVCLLEDGTERNVMGSIEITSVQAALDGNSGIKQEERELLQRKYEDIQNGEKLPLDYDYAIVHMLDVNVEQGVQNMLSEPANSGAVVEVTFDLGVAADAEVEVLKYYEGAWEPVLSVTNNGDGTITCGYGEHFCPNVFVVKKGEAERNAEKSGTHPMLWGAVFGASTLGMVALAAAEAKRKKHAADKP